MLRALLRRPRAVILAYHRVAELAADPYELCVKPARFAEQLQVARRVAHPLSLRALTRALASGRVPDRAVVFTFDDGYTDALEIAKPLLERYDVPATVFALTGPLDDPVELWWDELERLIMLPPALPERLELAIDGATRVYTLGAGPVAATPDFSLDRPGDPTPRHALFRRLWHLLRERDPDTQREALDQLRAWSGSPALRRTTHRQLDADGLARLAEGGRVEVGAHGVRHPILSRLPPKDQQIDIESSRRRLTEILNAPVESFAYPFGRPGDYDAGTRALVAGAGFKSASTTVPKPVRNDADPFQLPRFAGPNADGDRFEAWLRKLL